MATNPNYNPIRIQEYLFKLFDNKVCDNTYLTNPPIKLEAFDTDFMVIGLPTPLRDRNAYGEIKVSIEVFVKSDSRGGQSNLKIRDKYDALIQIIDTESTKLSSPYRLMKSNEGARTNYDDKSTYHVLIYFLTILIK